MNIRITMLKAGWHANKPPEHDTPPAAPAPTSSPTTT